MAFPQPKKPSLNFPHKDFRRPAKFDRFKPKVKPPRDDLAGSFKLKEFLFKSKETTPRETLENEEEIKPAEPCNEPVLLRKKSSWKKKKLKEDSLFHLLILEVLYADCFSPYNSDGSISSYNPDDTFVWLQDNDFFYLKQNIPEKLKNRVREQVGIIKERREEIIAEISPYLVGWDWERLTSLRQLILITAWYFIKTSSPDKISEWLNNAINHAKWFGDDKDYAFVNSILDKLITHHQLWSEKEKKAGQNID